MSDPLQNLSPCVNSRKIPAVQFKSASEVTEYLKRKTSSAYYTNHPASQKQAYCSTYTTFLGASAYKLPTIQATCYTNSVGIMQRPEKTAAGINKWNPT